MVIFHGYVSLPEGNHHDMKKKSSPVAKTSQGLDAAGDPKTLRCWNDAVWRSHV